MKRYTGQKALYEAISRSRAKARRGSILERLRPETTEPHEPPAPPEPSPPKPAEAPPEPPRTEAKESTRPLLEKLREAVIAKENARLRRPAPAANGAKPEEKPVPAPARPCPAQEAGRPAPAGAMQARWRVRPVQLHAGRIEVSVPYHIGVVVVLVLILAVLASFRIGQEYSGAPALAPMATETPVRATGPSAGTPAAAAETSSSAAGSTRANGDHWIVLAQHANQEDLVPVADYYAKHGVELSIYELGSTRQWFKDNGLNPGNLPGGDGYLLTTRYLYSNPNRAGTDGYETLQKIVELGQGYKAPPGRDTFAARHFGDAYGMKISSLTQ